MDVSGQGAISWRLSVLMWWGNLSAGAGAELLKYFYRSRSQSRGKSSVYPETYFDRNITTPTDQQTLQHLRSQGRKPPVTSTGPSVGILAYYTSKLPADVNHELDLIDQNIYIISEISMTQNCGSGFLSLTLKKLNMITSNTRQEELRAKDFMSQNRKLDLHIWLKLYLIQS